MVGRSRKQRSSSSSWSSEYSYNMGDLQYGAKLPEKKAKEEFLANPIRGYLTEDDTTLDNSSMGRSRKRNRHSKKEQHAKDEPFSLEDNQDSSVSSKKRNTRGRRKRVGKSRKRKKWRSCCHRRGDKKENGEN
ncbi:hypothetical protein KY285_007858 [Solanum tuberosum]|nr:hypothetical protein KY285_007858 [Solanum tuberosum]